MQLGLKGLNQQWYKLNHNDYGAPLNGIAKPTIVGMNIKPLSVAS